MEQEILWSLRLGFSAKEAGAIKKAGIKQFLTQSFSSDPTTAVPPFLNGLPITPEEVKAWEDSLVGDEGRKKSKYVMLNIASELRAWWVERMDKEAYPLREKMTLFLHNHFVSTMPKVGVNYWIYRHNQILRENVFGNFRDLTKKMLYTNAMVKYLDNDRNKNYNFNENLSRELLELFTLGIGNYTETDIKNGAKGLAGLGFGKTGAQYHPDKSNKEQFTYLGKTGAFKADEMVDIIFEQKNAPYLFTRKFLKWFIYNNPPEELVSYYGDFLRSVDYEIKPWITKIITREYSKPTAGSVIKDPSVFILHLINELNLKNPNYKLAALFLQKQGMELYAQPTVKGWDGGNSWISAQLYMQRNAVADVLCKGQNFKKADLNEIDAIKYVYDETFVPDVQWKKGNYKEIIKEMNKRLLFKADNDLLANQEAILKHDFDPGAKSAAEGVLQLFNYTVKTPEFQLV